MYIRSPIDVLGKSVTSLKKLTFKQSMEQLRMVGLSLLYENQAAPINSVLARKILELTKDYEAKRHEDIGFFALDRPDLSPDERPEIPQAETLLNSAAEISMADRFCVQEQYGITIANQLYIEDQIMRLKDVFTPIYCGGHPILDGLSTPMGDARG